MAQVGMQGDGDPSHLGRCDCGLVRLAEEAEDAGALEVVGQVIGSGHDVEVDVFETGQFGELRDVGFGASGDGVQSARHPDLPRTQRGSFLVGEISDGNDVSAWH
jgi:hypothetical protein